MRSVGALWKNGALHPGISQQGCVDSKEVGMTWEISAAANAVIGVGSFAGGDEPI
jgi:hypothetical protein